MNGYIRGRQITFTWQRMLDDVEQVADYMPQIRKRNGDIVHYDRTKIISAIFRAQQSLGIGDEDTAFDITVSVESRLNEDFFSQNHIPEVEEIQKDAKPTEFECPRCADGTKLEEMKFVQASDLLLDRCPKCKGIWLDKGEMIKVQKIAARIGDLKSKVMLASKHLKEKGYEVLGSKRG